MRKMLIAAALAAITVLSTPGAALGVCNTSESTADGLGRAYVVFVGTVTAVENNDRTAVFDVEWVWKGKNVYDTVTVHGGSTELTEVTAEDRQFQVGIRYLVATSNAAAPYEADRCTATRPWTGVGAVIPPNFQSSVGGATAGQAPDPVPVAVVESGTILENPLVPIAGGVVIVGGLVLVLGRVTRGPAHSSPGRSKRSGRATTRTSRLPSVGRGGEGFSGKFRRSGVSQAQKLRGIRGGKKGRKAARQAEAARPKPKKGGLRTDRLTAAADADPGRSTTKV